MNTETRPQLTPDQRREQRQFRAALAVVRRSIREQLRRAPGPHKAREGRA